MSGDCQVCRAVADPYIRHVTVECRYDVSEVAPMAERDNDRLKNAFTMTCCKSCRGDFLRLFGQWAHGEYVTADEPGGDIPVRVNGAVRMVTEETFRKLRGV